MSDSRILTNEEYTTLKGNYCPFCQSRNIEGGEPFVLRNDIIYCSNKAFQRVFCHTCNKIWDDIFVLVGYEEQIDS